MPTTKSKMSEQELVEYKLAKAALAIKRPWVFLRDFCITQDEHDLESPFKPFPNKLMYRVCVRAWREYDVLFIEKSRQIMMTWLQACLFLWRALFHKGQKIFFQSRKQEDANDVLERARTVYNFLVQNQFPGLPQVKTNKDRAGTSTKMELPDNKSVIRCVPQGPDVLRSQTISGVLSDEIAFQEQAEKAYTATLPAIHGGGKFMAQSTPNGHAFNWRMIYSIDEETGHPRGEDRVDSNRIRVRRYTPEQLMRMNEDEFDSIPFDELVACVPGMRFRVNFDGIAVLRIHYSADPDKSPDTEIGRRWIQSARATMSADAWEREMEISYDTFEGRSVISNFSRDVFVKKVPYLSDEPIYIGVDFGSEVCGAVFAQYVPIQGYNFKQLRILDEILLRNSSTPVLANEIIYRLENHYERTWAHRNFRCFPDPAGHQGRETVSDKSLNTSIKIFIAAGIPVTSKKFGVPESTDLVKTVFSTVAPNGEPAVIIDPRCEYMIRCCAGGWHYPKRDIGTQTGHPEKDGEFDHGGDMLRYLIGNLWKVRDGRRIRSSSLPKPLREKTTGRIVGWSTVYQRNAPTKIPRRHYAR